jgi:hypothetical protein
MSDATPDEMEPPDSELGGCVPRFAGDSVLDYTRIGGWAGPPTNAGGGQPGCDQNRARRRGEFSPIRDGNLGSDDPEIAQPLQAGALGFTMTISDGRDLISQATEVVGRELSRRVSSAVSESATVVVQDQ